MSRLSIQIVFLVLLVGAGQSLIAAQNCGDQDFRGVYGPLNQGWVVAVPSPDLSFLVGPFARIGRAVADGKGGFSAQTVDSANGIIGTGEITGSYSVSPDCSIVLNLMVPLPLLPFPLPFTFAGALADNGRKVLVMPVNPPGLAITLQLRRQDKANCTNRDLSKGFVLSLSGWVISQPAVTPGAFSRVGRIEFDGKGTFTANTNASYGGAIFSEAFSGTYSVDSSCMFTMQYSYGQSYTWTGMLTDNSSAANVLVSDPQGAVVAGTLTQQ